MTQEKSYVQYGCGLSAPEEWKNFDVSPTLRIQKTPIIGKVLRGQLNVVFPDNVFYGDIIKGLPVADNSCDGAYCSHTLEHLSLADFRMALQNTYRILKPGGIFRCVVPDLEVLAKRYIKDLDKGEKEASISFIRNTLLGVPQRSRGFKGLLKSAFGNAHHLWMWDHTSLALELEKVGFKDIRKCEFNDSKDEMFKLVEDKDRFVNAACIECYK
ncbi:MAG: methyltransferase domain-containing protein [Bacteroidota bacterium]